MVFSAEWLRGFTKTLCRAIMITCLLLRSSLVIIVDQIISSHTVLSLLEALGNSLDLGEDRLLVRHICWSCVLNKSLGIMSTTINVNQSNDY